MKRANAIAVWSALGVCGAIVLATTSIGIGANTETGRRAIERLVPRLTGGQIVIEGISGRFPDALRASHIELRDAGETWIRIEDLAVDWSPLRLLRGEVEIQRLAAARVSLLRLTSSAAEPAPRNDGFSLPVRVKIDSIDVGRVEIAAAVAGSPATVGVKGKAHVESMRRGSVDLAIQRLDAPAHYAVTVRLDDGAIEARVDVAEPDRGLLAGLVGLPTLGPLSVEASIAGPLASVGVKLILTAGPLRATGKGAVDLVAETLDVDLVADTPAMSPRDGLTWQSARLEAQLHGPFASPNANGDLVVRGLAFDGGTFETLDARLQGSDGAIAVRGSVSKLRLNALRHDIFAGAPVELRVDTTLSAPTRPVEFSLSHPALTVIGRTETARAIEGTVAVTVPSLAPFAVIAGTEAEGHAAATAKFSLQEQSKNVSADGTLSLTGGGILAALLGTDAKLSFAATQRGADIAVDRATIDGATLHAELIGTEKADVLDANWRLALSDLSLLAPNVFGAFTAQGRIQGHADSVAVTGDVQGELGAKGVAKGPFTGSLVAKGLPSTPTGDINLQGTLAGSPLQLAAKLRQDGEATHATIERAQWKSAEAHGELMLPAGATMPLGKVDLRMGDIGELAPFIGAALTGSVTASVDTIRTRGAPQSNVQVDARRLGLDGHTVERLTLIGQIADPANRPNAKLRLNAEGIAASGVTGTAALDIAGPFDALALRLSSTLNTPDGPVSVTSAATARQTKGEVQVNALQAQYRGETARLLSPAVVRFANGVTVDSLRVGVRQAVFAVAGRVSPTLDLTASARDLSLVLAKLFISDIDAQGTITADARLRGTPAAPYGSLRVSGRQLRPGAASTRALPAADLDATAELAGDSIRFDGRMVGGSTMRLSVSGAVPRDEARPLELRVEGAIDLAILDPMLTPSGRSARGKVTIAADIAGTRAAPRATGTVALADGAVQDFTVGVRVTDLVGQLQLDGDLLRIERMTGRAGEGTISVGGTVAALAPGVPVDLSITARKARPLASDLLSAVMDADLTLRGQASESLKLAGRILVNRADINIPDRMPQSVAVLDVRRPGQHVAPTPSVAGSAIGLDLIVDAPEQIFVRGHGLDAELGGRLDMHGTTADPQIGGGFDLRRGDFSLAGQTLHFSSGKVAFDGIGPTGKLNPTLDFTAKNTSGEVTAILTITGYADAPKIQLSSTPELPQDEILAQLLFGQSTKQLNPLQLAQIAQAIGSLTGVGGGGSDILAKVRTSLGLDRLTATSAAGDSGGAALEAGKYVAQGVYVGTKQGTSGGTQAKVQVDLTKRLKLESTLGVGGGVPATGATPDNDPGSSVGLTYQFEY